MSEENTSTEAVSTESSTATTVESTPTVSTSTPTSTSAGAQSLSSAEQAVESAFNPDFKFKVMDEEKEIDEWIRPFITDQEKQQKIKELYEKAHGLDYAKPKHEALKQKYESMEPQYQALTGDLKLLGQHLKNQDLGSFFKSFKLTDEQILDYAVKRLEYMEAPPEVKKQMEAEEGRKSQLAQVSLDNEQLRSYKKDHESQVFQKSFQDTMSRPEIQAVAQSFDSRTGKSGSFTEAIIEYGKVKSIQAGRNLPIPEIVQGYIQTFGLTPQPSQVASGAQVGTGSTETAQRKETLPKVQSSGASPVAQKVKSLQDLKNLQAAEFAKGHG